MTSHILQLNIDSPEVKPEDARDIVRFLDLLLEFAYDVPVRINEYRNRDNN